MKLLALVEEPDHVCCRYRIRAFEPALADAGWSLTCQGLDRGAFFRAIQLHRAKEFDAVILQRKLLAGLAVERPAPRCTAPGIRLRRRGLVSRLLFHIAARKAAGDPGVLPRPSSTADTVVAGNDFLADEALRAGASVERVHVIPTCVEPGLYPIARPARPRRARLDRFGEHAPGARASPADLARSRRAPFPV